MKDAKILKYNIFAYYRTNFLQDICYNLRPNTLFMF